MCVCVCVSYMLLRSSVMRQVWCCVLSACCEVVCGSVSPFVIKCCEVVVSHHTQQNCQTMKILFRGC
jgi:hypothetical protein